MEKFEFLSQVENSLELNWNLFHSGSGHLSLFGWVNIQVQQLTVGARQYYAPSDWPIILSFSGTVRAGVNKTAEIKTEICCPNLCHETLLLQIRFVCKRAGNELLYRNNVKKKMKDFKKASKISETEFLQPTTSTRPRVDGRGSHILEHCFLTRRSDFYKVFLRIIVSSCLRSRLRILCCCWSQVILFKNKFFVNFHICRIFLPLKSSTLGWALNQNLTESPKMGSRTLQTCTTTTTPLIKFFATFADFQLMFFAPKAYEENLRTSRHLITSPPTWPDFYRRAQQYEETLQSNRLLLYKDSSGRQ